MNQVRTKKNSKQPLESDSNIRFFSLVHHNHKHHALICTLFYCLVAFTFQIEWWDRDKKRKWMKKKQKPKKKQQQQWISLNNEENQLHCISFGFDILQLKQINKRATWTNRFFEKCRVSSLWSRDKKTVKPLLPFPTDSTYNKFVVFISTRCILSQLHRSRFVYYFE